MPSTLPLRIPPEQASQDENQSPLPKSLKAKADEENYARGR